MQPLYNWPTGGSHLTGFTIVAKGHDQEMSYISMHPVSLINRGSFKHSLLWLLATSLTVTQGNVSIYSTYTVVLYPLCNTVILYPLCNTVILYPLCNTVIL